MKTMGRSFGWSDLVTLDVNFPFPSLEIYVSGNAGNIVYENTNGENQYFPNAQQYSNPKIAARRILSSGVVNGVMRETTATDLVYCSTVIY